MLGGVELAVEVAGQHVDDGLVGGHHDGRVGNLSYQLRAQSSADRNECD